MSTLQVPSSLCRIFLIANFFTREGQPESETNTAFKSPLSMNYFYYQSHTSKYPHNFQDNSWGPSTQDMVLVEKYFFFTP